MVITLMDCLIKIVSNRNLEEAKEDIQNVLDPEKEAFLPLFHLRNHKLLRTKSLSSFKFCVSKTLYQIW